MPMYMDIHEVAGATPEALQTCHFADLKVQDKYDVTYHKYWLNESQGKVFCLCTAPNAEAATNVHREAHGLVAQKIIEVSPEIAEGFLGGCEVNPAGAALIPGSADERDNGIRTVLFTDIVNSTQLTQRVGDDEAMRIVQLHDSIVRKSLKTCGGREIKHLGDGIMAAFVSAAAAVRCTSHILHDLAAEESPIADYRLELRIGVAAGEPVEQNNDLFGSTVQLAARLCAHAQPEEGLVSNVVAELCIGKGLTFRDVGEVLLKGFETPVHVHAVAC
jgi:class 3 adenylate cyclase